MLAAFSRASSPVIFPSATASFSFSVIIEVIVDITSSAGIPFSSATSPRVSPSSIPALISVFSSPRLSITAPRR